MKLTKVLSYIPNASCIVTILISDAPSRDVDYAPPSQLFSWRYLKRRKLGFSLGQRMTHQISSTDPNISDTRLNFLSADSEISSDLWYKLSMLITPERYFCRKKSLNSLENNECLLLTMVPPRVMCGAALQRQTINC